MLRIAVVKTILRVPPFSVTDNRNLFNE